MREESVDTRLRRGLFEREFGLAVLFGNRVVTFDDDRAHWIAAKVKDQVVCEVEQRQHRQCTEDIAQL